MNSCPTCLQPVELQDKHWGTLFTCPHCSAVFFIDWNGQPEMAQHEAPMASIDSSTTFEADEIESQNSNFEAIASDSGSEFNPSMPEAVPFVENPIESPIGEGSFQAIESDEEVVYSPQIPVESSEFEGVNSFDSNERYLDQSSSTFQATSDSTDLSEVSEFANSNQAIGPLSYEIKIVGIDSSHLILQLKEALTDSRFGWDSSDLISSITRGTLIIQAVSPAKASVLINRIRYLPFKISWRQDVLSSP